MANKEIQSEFAKSQIEQAIETLRTQFSLLIQIATVLVVANATIVGYAVSQHIVGILLVGPLFPIIILSVAGTIFRTTVPIIHTAVSLVHKLGGRGFDWLASTFLIYVAPEGYVDEIKAISSIKNDKERIERLRILSSPMFRRRSKMRIALVFVTIAEIAAPLVLYFVFGWPLFWAIYQQHFYCPIRSLSTEAKRVNSNPSKQNQLPVKKEGGLDMLRYSTTKSS